MKIQDHKVQSREKLPYHSANNQVHKGSGTNIQEINKLLKQFEDMRKMVKLMSNPRNMMGMMSKLKGMGGMPGM